MEPEIANYYESEIAFTEDYVSDIKAIFTQSRQYAKNHVNYAMVYAYWLTGKRINKIKWNLNIFMSLRTKRRKN